MNCYLSGIRVNKDELINEAIRKYTQTPYVMNEDV